MPEDSIIARRVRVFVMDYSVRVRGGKAAHVHVYVSIYYRNGGRLDDEQRIGRFNAPAAGPFTKIE